MKKHVKRILSLLSFIYIFCTLAYTQPPQGNFHIKGQVVETETGQLLEYVNVVVYSQKDSSIVSGTITDKAGNFNIQLNRAGRFYITADFIGYEKNYIEKVSINPENQIANLGVIKLKPARVGIDEVEVVAEKPFVSYKLDRKVVDVSRNPSAQGGTAVDALENVPSVDIDIEGNVLVRGSSSFTVLIDGRQSPLSGSDALSQIPASAISEIEIITNPSAKYDPDGTAGIINIITKKGKLNGHSMVANASAGNSPLTSADITYSYRSSKATYTGSTGFRDSETSFKNYNDRETIIYDSITEEPVSKSNIFTDRNGTMKRGSYFFKGGIDYQISESNTFNIGGSFNHFIFGRSFDSKNQTTILDSNTYELTYTDFEVQPETWQINVGDKHIFNDNKDNYLSADFMYQWRNSEANDKLAKYKSKSDWARVDSNLISLEKAMTSEEAERVRLEVNYSAPIFENAIFEAGYTYRSDAYTQNYNRFFKDSDKGNWIPNSEFDDIANFERYIHAGWAVIRGKLADIQYSAGLRLEHTDRTIATVKDNWDYNYNYLGWYPSLSIAKEWEGGHTLQGSYSKRINRPRDHHLNPFPRLSDGYTQYKPNPELQPEYATSFELNYQKAWGSSFIAVETFYRYTENEMDRINLVNGDTLYLYTENEIDQISEVKNDTLIYTIINLGSERDIGGELTLNLKITKWWTFNPMTTVSYNTVEGTYANNYNSVSSLNFRASMDNNFFFPSKTRLQIMSNYRGARKEIDGTREPSYWFSAAVRQEFFKRKLSATLRVDDIFGTRKREGYTYSGPTTIYSLGQRKSPIVVFSLSYKLNPSNDRKKNGRENGGGEDGGDMDF